MQFFRYLFVLLVVLPVCRGWAADPSEGFMERKSIFQKTLISVDENIRVEEWSLSAKDVPGTGESARWTIRKSVLHGGRQEGVDVIAVDNGRMRFQIIPTRGMGLWEARCGDLRLGWESPVTEVVHPAHVELNARGGLGWLDGFGEWINRCGLESNGAPGPDEIIDNNGNPRTIQLTLHGRISYLPARVVTVSIDAEPPHTIRVRGIVDEVMMFGPRLRLFAEIATVPGSTSITLADEVRNLGGAPQEMQTLYHCNFGAPLLEDGARFVGPVATVSPRDPRAAEENGVAVFDRYGPPKPGYVEQVYFLELKGDSRGETEVLLKNRAGDRGASLRYALKDLPYFTVWKNTTGRESGYAVGLEPGTNFPNPRAVERKAGRVVVLKPGGSHKATLTVTAHVDSEAVRAAEERVQAIR